MTSGLLLHICVAAMLIWKPPAKPVSEEGSIESDEADNSAKSLQSSAVCGDATSVTNADQCFNLKNIASSKDVVDQQMVKTQDQEFGDKLEVSPKVQCHIVTEEMKTKHLRKSILYHTFSVLKNRHYLLYLVNNFSCMFGMSILFTHLIAFVESQGRTKSLGNLMLSILAVTSIIGRIVLTALCQQTWVNSIILYIVAVTLCCM